MDQRDCYFDANDCLVCPEIDPVAAVPPKAVVSPNFGWNAGARSVTALDGDLHAKFTMGGSENGVIIGLHDAASTLPPVSPAFITHGWYFFNLRGGYAARYESGAQVGDPVAYNASDEFEIRRVDGVVSYVLNGTTVAISAHRSNGRVRMMTCLYAAGDTAPGSDNSSGAGTDIVAVNGDNGPLASGVQITLTTPNNPSFANDAYWSIDVPSGASQLLVELVDNATGGFASDAGYLIVSQDTVLDGSDSLASVAPYSVTVSNPAAGTWYVFLDADIVISGLKLTATVT
jgi:hypothetical protein